MDTTPSGVSQSPVAPEDQFQSLFDAGAFEPSVNTDAPAQAAPEPQKAEAPPAAEKPAEAPAEAKTEAPAEEEAESYATLDEFLSKNQIDASGFQSLPVTVKIDGETRLVPLSEVVKSFQLSGHVNNKSIELSNAQKALEQEREAARTAYNQQLQTAKTIAEMAQNQLLGDYQRIDWNTLRNTNPAEYAATMTEFQQKQAAISAHLNRATQLQEAEAQRARDEMLKALPQQQQKMIDARPEWKDASAFAKDKEAMTSYAKQIGFSDNELSAIYDHRYMLILSDAARYRALQAAKPEAVKRVRAAPLMAKPGTRTNADPKKVAQQQALERYQKNPRDNDAAAAYFDTLA